MEQHRRLSLTSSGTHGVELEVAIPTIRKYEAWSTRGRVSGHASRSRPSRIKRPLINGTLTEGSDQGSSVVHFGPKPARVETQPPPPQPDVLGFSKRQNKRLGIRGIISEVLPKRLESSLKPDRPKSPLVRFNRKAHRSKPPVVRFINDDDLPEYHLPQSKLRTLRFGVRVVSAEEESDERLDAALHYWNAQEGRSIDEPSEIPSSLDAAVPTKQFVAGWGFGSVPRHARLFSMDRANTGRNLSQFQTPRSMSAGVGRAIHTTSIVGEHHLVPSLNDDSWCSAIPCSSPQSTKHHS